MGEDKFGEIIEFIPKRYEEGDGRDFVGEDGGIIIDFAEGKKKIETYRQIERMYAEEEKVSVKELAATYKNKGLDLEKVLNKMTDFVLKELSTERPHNLSIYQFVVLLTHEELKAKGIVAMDLSFFTEPITRVLKKIEAERNEK